MNKLAIAILFCCLTGGCKDSSDPSQASPSEDSPIASLLDSPPNAAKVVQSKTFTTSRIPKFDHPFDYTDSYCVFVDQNTFVCVRPLTKPQCGELILCQPQTGRTNRTTIPQPAGVKSQYDFLSLFEDAGLWAHGARDLFIRWQIEGNGDHGLAVFTRESKRFVAGRSNLTLVDSRALAAPDGNWYLIRWTASLYQGYEREIHKVKLGNALTLELLGKSNGPGHHSVRTLDASFRSDAVIHLIWAEVLGNPRTCSNFLRIKTADFDVNNKKWSAERLLFRQDIFTGWAHPAVIMTPDESIHYFWTISEGAGPTTERGGLFYQSNDQEKAVRLSASIDGFKTIALSSQIVVCYTLPEEANKIFFRVIDKNQIGPETWVMLEKKRDHSLTGEYFALGVGSNNRLWLVNTLDINVFYELKIETGQ